MNNDLTLAVVLTAGGATAAAALITGVIAMLKNLDVIGPRISGNEPTLAFALSAVLVAAAFWVSGPWTPEGGFAALLAWFGIAQIAMGVHDTVKSVVTPKLGPSFPATEPTTPAP